MEHALPAKPYAGVVDATNIDNPWQGSIRFGTLDLDLLAGRILDDLTDVRGSGISVRHNLALTCLDQIAGKAAYVAADVLRRASPQAMALEAVEAARAEDLMLSYGPTRETLRGLPRLAMAG